MFRCSEQFGGVVDQLTSNPTELNEINSNPGVAEAEKKSLLLVDDEENVLRALQRVLRRDGYTLHLASSAEKALQILAVHPVDVVLSDHRMPGQSGTEFLSKVKELYPRTVRLMLSGYTEVRSVTSAINEGAIYKFLTKPWDDDQLRANIKEAFHRHQIEAENLRLHVQIEEVNSELLQLNHALEQELLDRNLRIERDTSVACVMQEILDYMPLGVVGIDSAAEIVWVNRWAADLFGSPSAAFMTQSVQSLPSPLPGLIDEYLFGFDLQPQTHFAMMCGVNVQIEIKPMGLRSDSSGCLVLVRSAGESS